MLISSADWPDAILAAASTTSRKKNVSLEPTPTSLRTVIRWLILQTNSENSKTKMAPLARGLQREGKEWLELRTRSINTKERQAAVARLGSPNPSCWKGRVYA